MASQWPLHVPSSPLQLPCHTLMSGCHRTVIQHGAMDWFWNGSGNNAQNTVRCRYNAVNFLQNTHNRHPIAWRLSQIWGLLKIQHLIDILPVFRQTSYCIGPTILQWHLTVFHLRISLNLACYIAYLTHRPQRNVDVILQMFFFFFFFKLILWLNILSTLPLREWPSSLTSMYIYIYI